MKTYCKPASVNIESTEFNAIAVHLAFDGKGSKRDFKVLLTDTGLISKEELADEKKNHSCIKILPAIDAVAERLTQRIRDRDLKLTPVRSFQRVDGISQKLRDLNQETAENQIFERMDDY